MFGRSAKIKRIACSLKLSQGTLSYVLSRSSRRRTLVISVDESAQVAVASPHYVAQQDIERFIQTKQDWVFLKIREAQANQQYVQRRQFDVGDQFLFLGKSYPMGVAEQAKKRSTICFDGDKWQVQVPQGLSTQDRRGHVRKRLLEWYRMQAQEVLGGRIFHFARLIGVEPKEIAVRTQKRMWGCCDYRAKKIHLNWQIILSPMAVIDYVVVHELCHLIEPNHSKRFWQEVQQILPDFNRQRQWLKRHSLDMQLPL